MDRGASRACVAVLSRYGTYAADLLSRVTGTRPVLVSSLSLSSRTNLPECSPSQLATYEKAEHLVRPALPANQLSQAHSERKPRPASPFPPPRDSQSTQDGLPLHQPRRARRYHPNQDCRSGLPGCRRQRYSPRSSLFDRTAADPTSPIQMTTTEAATCKSLPIPPA